MNYYENYKNSRDAVWRFLLEDGISELPISVSEICRRRGILVKMYDGPGEDGFTEHVNGRYNIYISTSIEHVGRRRFTAAHELGHIILGHVGREGLVNREPSERDNPIEREANVFASRLLAPACVLWGCNAYTPEQIMQLCNISRQAAEFRAARMRELRTRGRFLSSPLERAVYEQFSSYIEEHRF